MRTLRMIYGASECDRPDCPAHEEGDLVKREFSDLAGGGYTRRLREGLVTKAKRALPLIQLTPGGKWHKVHGVYVWWDRPDQPWHVIVVCGQRPTTPDDPRWAWKRRTPDLCGRCYG